MVVDLRGWTNLARTLARLVVAFFVILDEDPLVAEVASKPIGAVLGLAWASSVALSIGHEGVASNGIRVFILETYRYRCCAPVVLWVDESSSDAAALVVSR